MTIDDTLPKSAPEEGEGRRRSLQQQSRNASSAKVSEGVGQRVVVAPYISLASERTSAKVRWIFLS